MSWSFLKNFPYDQISPVLLVWDGCAELEIKVGAVRHPGFDQRWIVTFRLCAATLHISAKSASELLMTEQISPGFLSEGDLPD